MLKRPSPGFDGPDCFNTALLATGVLPFEDVRYVDSEEFEFLLSRYFDPVKGKPQIGDLVLYGASDSRDHAAVYIGDGRVFHKKDWHGAYEYRVVGIDRVSAHDPGDDRPRRPEDKIPSWDQAAVRDRAYFRRKPSPAPLEIPPELVPTEQVLSYVHGAVLESGPRWKVGETLGIVTENLMGSIWSRLSEESASGPAETALTVLAKSLVFQLEQSIDAEHFRSIYAQANPEPIRREIYFKDNEFLRKLIRLVGEMEGVEPDVDGVIARLEADRPTRRMSLLEAVH
jgi:hypothetical protein